MTSVTGLPVLVYGPHSSYSDKLSLFWCSMCLKEGEGLKKSKW